MRGLDKAYGFFRAYEANKSSLSLYIYIYIETEREREREREKERERESERERERVYGVHRVCGFLRHTRLRV